MAASRTATYEPTNLLSLKADLKTGKDVENAIIVHRELNQLTPALADRQEYGQPCVIKTRSQNLYGIAEKEKKG